MNVHFSKAIDLWVTPDDFFARYHARFHFETDVCATSENTKCPRFFDKEQDGLTQEWTGVCWMNPPYGRTIGKWIRKTYESSLRGATVVCLVPARTDTRWWHEYVMKGEIEFIKGRLKFSGHNNNNNNNNNAPFPNAVVVFRPKREYDL